MLEKLVLELLKKGKRLEKRGFLDYREIKVENNVIPRAEGSSRVKIGNTEVIAGIKLELSEPFKDEKESGVLIVNAEFAPIAHATFEPGPPSEEAIELARLVDRLIRSSKTINFEKLKISDELVYGVFIDIHVINHDGNLLDASALAALNALNNCKIPKYEDGKLIRNEIIGKLEIKHKPLYCTIACFEDKFLVDLNQYEENVVDSKIAIGLKEDNTICAIQLLSGKIDYDKIEKILEIAEEKTKYLRNFVF